jgi:hypothetical protein
MRIIATSAGNASNECRNDFIAPTLANVDFTLLACGPQLSASMSERGALGPEQGRVAATASEELRKPCGPATRFTLAERPQPRNERGPKKRQGCG